MHQGFRRRLLIGLSITVLISLAVASVAPDRGESASGDGTMGTPKKVPSNRPIAPNYDIRVGGQGKLATLIQEHFPQQVQEILLRAQGQRRTMLKALVKLRGTLPQARAKLSASVGSAELVWNTSGPLTNTDFSRPATEIALGFIASNAGLYGLSRQQVDRLQVLGESLSPKSGLRMVRIRQMVHGIPVFQSETRVTVDREGRLIRTVGLLVPGAEERLIRSPTGQLISAREALRAALATVGIDTDTDSMTLRKTGQDRWITEVVSEHPEINLPVPSRLVYFALGPGVLVPAWSQIIFLEGPVDWYTVVDALTGTLLYRKNIQRHASTEDALFSVYTQVGGTPADSPAPGTPNALLPGSGTQFPEIARTIRSMLAMQDSGASPDGWIPDGSNTTTGNNVDAYLDRDADELPDTGTLDNDGRPIGNPNASGLDRNFLGNQVRDFDYTPPPVGGNPDAGDSPLLEAYQRGAVTNLFYIANYYHDRLYGLGFDEAAGNFQTNNFGRGGVAGDPVLAQAQFGADIGLCCNSSTTITPDGTSPRIRMRIFSEPSPSRDSSLDTAIVFHELTHGLVNRLIGNLAGINWAPAFGMEEGWSDFYALSLLNDKPTDDPDGQYAGGAFTLYKEGGSTDNYVYAIRRFPYTTDNTVNPLTWADVDETTFDLSGGFLPNPIVQVDDAIAPHNIGEIWALSLWEVRSRIIAANGGDVALGNEIMLQIVTDALKMTPNDPSFTEARDALFEADCATNACANEELIWAGFADRGLGFKAEASLGIAAHVGIKESFAIPFLDIGGISIDDSAGDNNGFIDPGETISITVNVFNPWRQASKSVDSVSAILSTTTPEISISDATSDYAAIPPQSVTPGDPFTYAVDPGAFCGQSLAFDLETTSSLGTFTAHFQLRVGQPIGAGTPVTFTRSIAGGLAIPDCGAPSCPGNPGKVTDTFTITDDLEIVDLDFRLDSLTHTWVGDLSVMLKAPSGFGTDIINRPAGCSFCPMGNNSGNDFIDTRFDDISSNDLMSAASSAAPFTGDWSPSHNSLYWSTSDLVGQLSHYNGLSTRGDWQVFIADFAILDTGSLDSWSLIVTPMAFSCCQGSPDPDGDNVGSACDTCPGTFNPRQAGGDLDSDGDGFTECAGDCDDANGTIYPGAPQICDGANNDCGHVSWPALTATNDQDDDGDGFSECAGDCDDANANLFPGNFEACDNLDNDCDGTVDGFVTTCGRNCNSTGFCSAGVDSCKPRPGSAEICDNLDNDCDGIVDEFVTTCGSGVCASTGFCSTGIDTCTPAVNPEVCDNLDNDCDGTVDEFATSCGIGECAASGFCTAGVDTCTPGTPSAEPLTCDLLDNDCDGLTDEGLPCDTSCDQPEVSSTAVFVGSGSWPSIAWNGSAYGITAGGPDGISFTLMDARGRKLLANTTLGAGDRPMIIWNGAEFAVVWSAESDHAIMFLRLDVTGNPLATAIAVSDPAARFPEAPDLVWTGTEYGIVWYDQREGNDEIYFARVNALGIKLGSDVRITDDPARSGRTAFRGNGAEIVWTGSEYGVTWPDARDSFEQEIYFARLDASGNKIGNDLRVTNDPAHNHGVQQLLWTGTEYGLFFTDGRLDDPSTPDLRDWEIFFARISPMGVQIGNEIVVSTNTADPDDEDASLDPYPFWTGSEYVVLFADRRNTDEQNFSRAQFDIYLMRLDSTGAQIADDVRLTFDEPNHGDSSPNIAWDGSGFGIVWHSDIGAPSVPDPDDVVFIRVGCECASIDFCSSGIDVCAPGPPKAELCDNVDNDCDGTVDEFVTTCGVGECVATGFCTAGLSTCTPGSPAPEGVVCDQLDNDCDGLTDESLACPPVVYGDRLAFDAATAALGTPTEIDFESSPPCAGDTIEGCIPFDGAEFASLGVFFSNPFDYPLFIASENLSWNPSRSLSVGHFPFDPLVVPNSPFNDDDDLVIEFPPRTVAVGFNVEDGWKSAGESVRFIDKNGNVLVTSALPASNRFVGVVSNVGASIARIEIEEAPFLAPGEAGRDGDNTNYDNFVFIEAPLMTAEKLDPGGNTIELTWHVTTCLAPGHHLIYGSLDAVKDLDPVGAVCKLGTDGTFTWSDVPAGNLWFLVVSNDDLSTEGPWGERTPIEPGGLPSQRKGIQPSGLCGMLSRNNSTTCPQFPAGSN